jgi:hypothetical protein
VLSALRKCSRRVATQAVLDLFRSKTEDNEFGCWMWLGAVNNSGYGCFSFSDEKLAHRSSFAMHKGPIPAGLDVCHSCERYRKPRDISYRRCVNPAHLSADTRSANIRDAIANGRGNTGERNGHARHTDGDVREVRRLLSLGMSQREVAVCCDMHQTTVSQIARGTRRSRA